jgi:hypothetical protein
LAGAKASPLVNQQACKRMADQAGALSDAMLADDSQVDIAPLMMSPTPRYDAPRQFTCVESAA